MLEIDDSDFVPGDPGQGVLQFPESATVGAKTAH